IGPGDESGRRWIFVPCDQLTDRVGPLARRDPGETGIVLVESPWKAGRRPYHRQKLALVLANLRHFALEQARRGVAVRHVVADGPYREALGPVARELGPLTVMEPAERELRVDLAPLAEEDLLEVVPHEGWLTTREQFGQSQDGGPPWRMDAFYRRVRRDTGLLMENGSPAGGKYSHDTENRERWGGDPPSPDPPRFEPDEITREVRDLVNSRFGRHPGRVDAARLPATREHADRLWDWALDRCLEHFGPYEDAMSRRSPGLFHTRVSPLLNLHRLLPERVVRDAAASDAPLNSREGFVRQVLGWREFVRHVHRATDGFRDLPDADLERSVPGPGDGGWGRWAEDEWGPTGAPAPGMEGAAAPSFLGADGPLPEAWWGETSGLACLDSVVEDVWEEAWSHHITRLMVLSNVAQLLEVSPRELTDWFWVAYEDAYDWVVEPNVLGMGTFAAGDLMTTKPYVSGSNYIDRMSDYCEECRFDPGTDCPLRRLYWAYLDRHADELEDNRRMSLPLANLSRRGAEDRALDRDVFRWARETLDRGDELRPADQPT
nr:cryptochrome/photolyase family protein [Candidatus Palauibacterales bacterium]